MHIESAIYDIVAVRARLDMLGGDPTVCAADREVSTVPERRDPPSRATNHRTENKNATGNGGGGGLGGLLLALIALPVGWFVSVVAAMIVFTHYFGSDPPITLVPGVGPTTTFYASAAVVIVIGVVVVVKPAMITVWWGLMGVIVGVAGFFFVGWTTLLVSVEMATLMYVAPALFFLDFKGADTNTNDGARQYRKGVVTGMFLERWFR